MKLSIIVPVYNVERCLGRCLDSIAVEMQEDYELILVDDGSTDRSGSLCDDFAAKHPQLHVVVVHQTNRGVSAARNQGLELARGEYVTFVDSDDYLSPKSIVENMEFLLANPEVDLLEYPIEMFAESSKAYVRTFVGKTLHNDLFVDWVRRAGNIYSYLWNKIYKKHLWAQVRFPIDVLCFEDGVVMPDIIRACSCIHYSETGCYRYVLHSNSLTSNHQYGRLRQLFMNNYHLYMHIKNDALLSVETMRLWSSCLNQLIDMGRCADVDENDYRNLIADVHKHHPPYMTLLRVCRKIKLLPLPFMGIKTYMKMYLMFAPLLK